MTDCYMVMGLARSSYYMAAVGKPKENGYAERVIRSVQDLEAYVSDNRHMAEAKQQFRHFIKVVYQHKRIHSALDYKTPTEFESEMEQMFSIKFTVYVSSFIRPIQFKVLPVRATTASR